MTTRFLNRRSLIAATVLAAASLGLAGNVLAQDASKKQLVIGGTAGSNIDQLQAGIVPLLQKKGYKVKLVEFNDYVQPNLALADGSLDANFFQHEVYFNQFKGDRKLDLTALVQGPIAPMGVYSKQRKSLAELKEGDRIALPNDPSNLARGLLLLQQAGLVKLKPGVNLMHVMALTRSIGELRSPKDAQPEVYRWTDTGGSYVDCTLLNGKVVQWEMTRPPAPADEADAQDGGAAPAP